MDAWQQIIVRQQGLATRAQLAAAGLSRRRLDRLVGSGALTGSGRGLYRHGPPIARAGHLLSGGSRDPGYVAEVRAALLRLGAGACAARRTAAVLWGFDMLVEPASVEVDVPHGRRVELPGVEAQQSRSVGRVLLRPVAGCEPIAATSAVDTVLDCAVDRPLQEAVAIADSALRTRACTVKALRRAATARRGTPFAGRIWRVLRWTDRRSGSVLESALRVLLCEAGLVPPSTQHCLRDADGRLVARVDVAWPVERLVVEADGRRWHDPEDRRVLDRWRSNACATLGWLVLRFSWADVVHHPERVVASVRETLAAIRARAAPVASEV